MASLKDHFESIRYFGKYQLGDRVTGVYKGVRWIGSVGNDRIINEQQGPTVTIHLDLPFQIKDEIHKHILIVKPKDIKRLTNYDE